EAGEMINQNYLPEDIVYRLNQLSANMSAYFMVDDLGHLQRGGRLSGAQNVIGSVLNIKPVLHITKGEVRPSEKIRSRKKALERIFESLEQDSLNKSSRIGEFMHSNNEAAAKASQTQFNDNHPTMQTYISYFGPVIGTHLGEGAIGATWYYE